MTAAPMGGPSGAPLGLAALAAAYRDGRVTPVDVVRDIEARIADRGDDAVWIRTDIPHALASAEQLGSDPDPLRPLWGIPFAVKDNLDVAGWMTTGACPGFAYAVTETATAVQRLLEAGAILIGKTNLDQFATGLNGTRSPYGIPRSVADPEMISGGSSSGSAVAVAAGLVAFSLGTDTAGSGRVPAALNGIVGHKPSRGLVSNFGMLPACRSLDCVSVFALDVDDAALVVDVMAGVDQRDPWSRPLPGARPTGPVSLAGLRVAIPRPGALGLSDAHGYSDAWDASIARLREAGAETIEIDMAPFFEAGRLLYEGPWVAERLASIEEFLAAHEDDVNPVVSEIIARGGDISGPAVFRGMDRLRELWRDAAAALVDVDALLTPTTPTTFSVDEMLEVPIARNSALGRFTTYGNLLDLAVIALPTPFGRADRPFGVSIAARAGSDGRIAGIAAAMEAAFAAPVIVAAESIVPLEVPLDGSPHRSILPIAVVGAHLSGMPLNAELTDRGGVLVRTCTTAAEYRLVALDTTPPKPGLVRVADGGVRIDVEIYELPVEQVGTFLAGIATPLGLGAVRLDDGSLVHGFLCEAVAAAGAPDISAHGGWRAYLAAAQRA